MSDGIVLVGLPGSGKTSVGRIVADRLGRQFIDIDLEVERISGRTSADLIVRDGAPALRAVERQAVEAAVESVGAVIATGGGTVLDPLNRWRLMEHGVRVRLDAPADQLASRLLRDPGIRRRM
jgi:shikimate kinase